MKAIVSAFVQGELPHEQTYQTRSMLGEISLAAPAPGVRLSAELAVGVYKGQYELSAVVTGFPDKAQMMRFLGEHCSMYKQESAYFEIDGKGYLYMPPICQCFDSDCPDSSTITELGKELTCPVADWVGPLPDSYTRTFGGHMICAKESL